MSLLDALRESAEPGLTSWPLAGRAVELLVPESHVVRAFRNRDAVTVRGTVKPRLTFRCFLAVLQTEEHSEHVRRHPERFLWMHDRTAGLPGQRLLLIGLSRNTKTLEANYSAAPWVSWVDATPGALGVGIARVLLTATREYPS